MFISISVSVNFKISQNRILILFADTFAKCPDHAYTVWAKYSDFRQAEGTYGESIDYYNYYYQSIILLLLLL